MKHGIRRMTAYLARRTAVTNVLAATLMVLWVVIAVGEDGESPSATFFEPLNVPLVSVDVVVVDSRARPVPGLTAEDFEVREDGKPVEISHFYAAPGVSPEPVDDQPPDLAEKPVVPESDLFLAVYLDDSSIDPQSRRAALEHLQGFLGQPMPAKVKAMLAVYNGALTIRSDFTDRFTELQEEIDALKEQAPVNYSRESEMLVREMQSVSVASSSTRAGGSGGVGALSMEEEANAEMARAFLMQIDSHAQALHSRQVHGLEALTGFVRFLSGVHGRKAVLWVGSGLETRIGENLYATWVNLFPEQARQENINPTINSRNHDTTRYINEMVQYANSHRVAFYTLSSLGHTASLSNSAEVRNISLTTNPGIAQSMGEEEALSLMTDSTGGRILANNSGLDAQLAEVSEELGSFYSLGYRPPSPGDGAYHRIEVAVRRKGVTVRHRDGYKDASAQERMDNRTLAAAVLGVAENPLEIAVETGEQELRDDGTFLVPVIVQIPISQLVLLPAGENHAGQISVYTTVRDVKGRLSGVHGRQYPLEIPNDQLLTAVQQTAGFMIGMVMREGEQRIAISVRDDKSLVESTAFTDVVVGLDSEDTSG